MNTLGLTVGHSSLRSNIGVAMTSAAAMTAPDKQVVNRILICNGDKNEGRYGQSQERGGGKRWKRKKGT